LDAISTTARHDTRVLSLISSGHFLSHFYQLSLPPLLLIWRDEFGVSYAALGTVIALFGLATGLAQIPAGILVDRIGARPLLVGGLIIEALAISAMGFAPSLEMIYVAAVIAGIGNSVFHPADYAILNSSIDSGRMGKAFSIHTFSGHLGGSIAPASIIFLVALYDWQSAVMITGALGLVVAVLIFLQGGILQDELSDASEKNSSSDETPAERVSTARLMLSRQMILFFMFFLLASLTSSGVHSFSVVANVNIHEISFAVAGTALTAYLFASTSGILIGGVIADKATEHHTIALVSFLGSAVIFALFALFKLPDVLLIGLFIIAGLLQGILRPARDMMVRAVAPKGTTGRAFGFVSTGIALGSAIAPVFFGWIIDQQATIWVFWLLAIFTVGGAIIVLEQKRLGRD
jgi:MFS transporter, FSR family, fosmidomycin resistance protein